MLTHQTVPVLTILLLMAAFINPDYILEYAWQFHQKGIYVDQSDIRNKCEVTETTADCAKCELTRIPTTLPSNITTLLLSQNQIESVEGNELARYYNLRHLDLSYNKLQLLRNDSFWNLSNLEFLDLSNNKLSFDKVEKHDSSVEPGFLTPLANLRMFDFSMNEQLCLKDMIPLLTSITQSGVTRLRFQNVVNPYLPCVTLSREFADALPRGLQELVLASNSLSIVESEVLAVAPMNLSLLDLSDNRLTFGRYLMNLSKLQNLNVLKLNGGDVGFDLPTYYPSHAWNICGRLRSNVLQLPAVRRSRNVTILKLPRSLTSVEIKVAGWSYSLTKFRIDPQNSLSYLSLSGNHFPTLIGPLTGLNRLKQLDLFDCNIYNISMDFFCHFPSLEKLNLSMNNFGHILSVNSTVSPFKCLNNVKELDLSLTFIVTIHRTALHGLNSLEKLHMHNNPIYYFTASISHMTNLHFINFSFTELAQLNTHTIRDLEDIMQNAKRTVSIDFGEAPVKCECSNLAFLGWLVTANVTLINKRNKCVFADSSEQPVKDEFDAIHQMLQRQCQQRVGLFIVIFSVTAILIMTISGSIIYRFRWKLRYLYYSAYLSLKSSDKQTEKLNQFEYDVFISYVHHDQTFVLNTLYPGLCAAGLKVHLHNLYFVAGQPISSNIVNAIQTSRRTLAVLTRDFLDSAWCKFELQMANMEQVHTGRSVIIFLIMEDLDKRELGAEILYHIQNSTYIMYPEINEQHSQRQMDIFWTKLASDLRS